MTMMTIAVSDNNDINNFNIICMCECIQSEFYAPNEFIFAITRVNRFERGRNNKIMYINSIWVIDFDTEMNHLIIFILFSVQYIQLY